MCLPVKPYKVEKEWEAYGFKCAVTQARQFEHRCGYVRVPPDHPCFAKWCPDTDKLGYGADQDLNVHGGITFNELEPCTGHLDGQGLWLGFDCAHAGDAHYDPKLLISEVPAHKRVAIAMGLDMDRRLATTGFHDHYWTLDEVVKEVEDLAQQVYVAGQLAAPEGV